MEEVGLRENLLFGLGNILLDLLVDVDDEFLTKYGLKKDHQIYYHKGLEGLFEEVVEKYNVTYRPGGSVYNTMKTFQWMLQEPKKVATFVACVGKDKMGDIFMEDTKNRNIDGYFYEVDNLPTGRCAVLMTDKNCSMVTDLGAAKHYSKEKHLDLPENWKLVEEAEYYYLCCYTLLVSPESLFKISKYACDNNRHISFNLSASRIITTFKDVLIDLLKYTDYIFCNDKEAKTLAEASDYPSDNLEDVVKWIRELPKVNKTRERVVIVTCGPHDTIVATVNGISFYPVIPVDDKDLVDTCGAGDAVVGGFLSQLVQGKPLEDCIKAGHYAANVAIKGYGCTVPDFKPDFK